MAELTGDSKRLHPADSLSTASAAKNPGGGLLRRRRCCCICLVATLAVLLVLALVFLVLFLTVLRVRDPTATVASTRVTGVAPAVTIAPLSVKLNVTLLLTVNVHNPNPAAFAHGGGHTDLTYRGAHVGDAEVQPGRIPSRGDGTADLVLTVEADRFASNLAELVADIEAGVIELDTETRIPGRVTILGLFTRHAVAYSRCHVVIAVLGLKVQSQYCENTAKL